MNVRKLISVVLFVGLAACSSQHETVTGPSTEETTATAPQATVSPVDPVTVAPPASAQVTFYQGAGFYVKGITGKAYAYTTSFDDQTHASRVISGSGPKFEGSFDTTCVQLDLTQEYTTVGGIGGRPFAFAYFDARGKEFSPGSNPERVTECRRGTPTPAPSPTPSPEPTPTPSPSPTPVPECPEGQHRNPQGTCVGNPNDPTPEPTPTPTPAPGLCYYRVSGDSQAQAEVLCKAKNAGTIVAPIYGVWLNFDVDQSLVNHCKFPLPGVSDRDFELSPGQSAAGCLKKPTGNPNAGH